MSSAATAMLKLLPRPSLPAQLSTLNHARSTCISMISMGVTTQHSRRPMNSASVMLLRQPCTLLSTTSSKISPFSILRRAFTSSPARLIHPPRPHPKPSSFASNPSSSSEIYTLPPDWEHHSPPPPPPPPKFFTANAAAWILISLNAIVFIAGTYAKGNPQNEYISSKTFVDNTSNSLANWYSGRWWTVVTNAFTHHEGWHIAFNMVSLWSFASILAFTGVSGLHVIAIALPSALASSGAYLLQQKARMPADVTNNSSWRDTLGRSSIARSFMGKAPISQEWAQAYYSPAIGASGLVMGLGAVASCLRPLTPMNFMLIPVAVPLWLIFCGYVAYDRYRLNDRNSRTAHSAHLGGAAAGILYYVVCFRRAPGGVLNILARKFGRGR